MPDTPPSPCVGVCKFKRAGHCVGCSMTKDQKAAFKKMKKPGHRRAYIELVTAQQSVMGGFSHWDKLYDKKCRKKGVSNPSQKLRDVG